MTTKQVAISIVFDTKTVPLGTLILSLGGLAVAARSLRAEVFIDGKPWKEWLDEHSRRIGLAGQLGLDRTEEPR